MVCLWLLFTAILFIAEPLILHRHFRQWATARPAVAFAWLHRAHWVLLALSVVTILGAVTGSQGWSMRPAKQFEKRPIRALNGRQNNDADRRKH